MITTKTSNMTCRLAVSPRQLVAMVAILFPEKSHGLSNSMSHCISLIQTITEHGTPFLDTPNSQRSIPLYIPIMYQCIILYHHYMIFKSSFFQHLQFRWQKNSLIFSAALTKRCAASQANLARCTAAIMASKSILWREGNIYTNPQGWGPPVVKLEKKTLEYKLSVSYTMVSLLFINHMSQLWLFPNMKKTMLDFNEWL